MWRVYLRRKCSVYFLTFKRLAVVFMAMKPGFLLIMPKWHAREHYNSVRFKTVTSMTIGNTIISNMMPCSGENF